MGQGSGRDFQLRRALDEAVNSNALLRGKEVGTYNRPDKSFSSLGWRYDPLLSVFDEHQYLWSIPLIQDVVTLLLTYRHV